MNLMNLLFFTNNSIKPKMRVRNCDNEAGHHRLRNEEHSFEFRRPIHYYLEINVKQLSILFYLFFFILFILLFCFKILQKAALRDSQSASMQCVHDLFAGSADRARKRKSARQPARSDRLSLRRYEPVSRCACGLSGAARSELEK